MKKNIKKIDENSLKNSLKDIWQNNKNDPNGCYTGNAYDKNRPVQDADDL